MNLYVHIYGGQPTFIFGEGVACASSSSTEAVKLFTDHAARRKSPSVKAAPATRLPATPDTLCPACHGERFLPSRDSWSDEEPCETCYATGRVS